MPILQNPLVLSIIPAIIIGLINGWYWRKQGYSMFTYSFYGSIVAFGFILTIVKYFREN